MDIRNGSNVDELFKSSLMPLSGKWMHSAQIVFA